MMSLTSSMPIDRRTTSAGTCGLLLFRRQLRMGGGGRVDDQRARVADIGEMREELQSLDQLLSGFISTLDAEGEDRTCALRRIVLLDRVIVAVLQPGIVHPADLGMRLQPLGYGKRVVGMALDAQRQSFDAGQNKKRVERRNRWAEIAKAEHPAGNGKGKVAERLVQHDA